MTPAAKGWLALGAVGAVWWLWPSSAEASTTSSDKDLSLSQAVILAKIQAEALKQGVPVEFALANAEVESNFKNIKAAKGESYGPLQVHISSGYTPTQLSNVDFAIAAGVLMLKNYLKKAGGDSLLARIIYFCGPGYAKSCSAASIARLKARWAPVAAKWGVQPTYKV